MYRKVDVADPDGRVPGGAPSTGGGAPDGRDLAAADPGRGGLGVLAEELSDLRGRQQAG